LVSACLLLSGLTMQGNAQFIWAEREELRLKGPVKTLEIPTPDTGLKEVYIFNQAGKITEHSTLYRTGGQVFYKTVNTYDSLGRKSGSELFWETRSGSTAGIELRKRTVFKYDENGNAIEVLEYDTAGKLYYKTIKKYDVKGNILETAGKMEIGEFGLGPSSPAYFREYFKYDEAGRLIERQSFLADVKVPLGHGIFEYDLEGRMIAATGFTPTFPGKPPRIARSFATYNKQGDIIESRYYEPVKESNTDGFRNEFEIIDDKGTVKNGMLVSDRPFMILWSVNIFEYKYDLHGNWTEKMCKSKVRDIKDFSTRDNETPSRIITYYQ